MPVIGVQVDWPPQLFAEPAADRGPALARAIVGDQAVAFSGNDLASGLVAIALDGSLDTRLIAAAIP